MDREQAEGDAPCSAQEAGQTRARGDEEGRRKARNPAEGGLKKACCHLRRGGRWVERLAEF